MLRTLNVHERQCRVLFAINIDLFLKRFFFSMLIMFNQ